MSTGEWNVETGEASCNATQRPVPHLRLSAAHSRPFLELVHPTIERTVQQTLTQSAEDPRLRARIPDLLPDGQTALAETRAADVVATKGGKATHLMGLGQEIRAQGGRGEASGRGGALSASVGAAAVGQLRRATGRRERPST